MRPRIEAVQPVLGSRDVAASVRFYEQLGFVRVFVDDAANPRYAAVVRDGAELHLQWHDAKEWADGFDRPAYRFVVADVDGLHREFRAAGVLENITPVMDTSWGTREFHVRDADGNGLQFYRAS
ncbi:MAG: VOC family protein [Planctomycetes bacterium]|nr:VOC family protein [Planctomycetota bacterium]